MAGFDPIAEGATPFDPEAEGATAIQAEPQKPEGSNEEMRSIAFNIAKVLFGTTPGGYVAQNIGPLTRGAMGAPEPEGADLTSRAANLTGGLGVQAAGQVGLAALTGGASIPVQGAGLAAKAATAAIPALERAAVSGAISGGQKGVRDIAAGQAPEGVVSEAGKSALASMTVEGMFGAAGQAFKLAKPGLVRLGAQMIQTTSAVPEKYGRAVLESPEILTTAPSLKAASSMYRRAVNGMKGAREFLQSQSKTGDIVMDPGDADKLLNQINKKIGTSSPPSLQEALAARQAASFMLDMAKMGDPKYRASRGAILEAKENLDDILEAGIPGFKETTKTYFQANAREAFQSLMPQRKNLSANALRGLSQLSFLSAAALMKAPLVLAGAAAFSPKATGLMIRGGKSVGDLMASQSSKFAARIAAIKAVENNEDRPKP